MAGKRKMTGEQPNAGKYLTIRCEREEQERFAAAATEEGFQDRTAWMLFHLRKQARKTLKEQSE